MCFPNHTHTDMNGVLFFIPVFFCFLISIGSAENPDGYDSKNPPWDALFAPFEPGKSRLTTPPVFYKRIFNAAWNKVFGPKEKYTPDRYHCLKKKYSVHVIAKYFHYTFTMRKPTGPKILDYFTKIPIVGKLFQQRTTVASS